MHPHIATILAAAAAGCIFLGSTHADPLLPLPFPVLINNRNFNRNKPHTTQLDSLSTGNNQTYKPPYPNPGILAPLPSWFKWPPPDALAVTPRYKPIYTTDELVDFVVDVPKDSLQTVVTLHFGGAGSTPFKASVRPGTNVLSVPKGNIGVSSTAVSAVLGSVEAKATFAIYQEPTPGTSHIVRVDYLHGSLVPQQSRSPLTSASPPLFPFGMYAGFSNFGEVDPVGAMKELKEMGINHVNFVPPYGDGKHILACIKAAHDVGVSIQYDMRHTYVNTTTITAEVNSFKAYDSVATWYTADEPDGQSIASEPKASTQAYRTIQSLDPHRPVMLVLNFIRNSAAQFADAADILMTDVYPVGLSPSSCNYSPEGGCCGCDGCFGDLGTDIRRRMQSYRSQLAKIGKPRMPIWMVLQAFSDPNTCWSRAPTPEEYRLMAYLSLIYGAKGLMGWIYPQGLTPELKASIPGLSAELVPLASRYILGGEQILEHTDTKRQIAAGVWVVDGTRMYVVTNTSDKAVTLTDGEVATIFGEDAALAEGRRVLKSLAVLTLTTA
ncbi:hypothetical protein BG015_002983 [Linnemannia schmuckeri]|uniref:Uncharacterized protein n=1 Tax=Linnemannia schmuckeri TaxID=64567 RepID=A0A9P5RMX3_9FUNG|nr:hypothetical protein BG015_002983 [Linnemannia schmuckeri]